MDDIEALADQLADSPEALELVSRATDFYYTFRPRPDRPELHDQQHSFVFDQVEGVAGLLGGNACLAGETMIYDPVAEEYRRIDSISSPFHVLSLNQETGQVRVSPASCPFVKGECQLVRVVLSNGESFACSPSHRVLCQDAEWREVRSLRVGDGLFDSAALALWATVLELAYADGDSHKVLHEGNVQVTAISPERVDKFYDLQVPGDNNYLCAGVVHHNSGTSEAAAAKLAKFVLHKQPPNRPDLPFWVCGPKLDQVIKTFWKEKLHGHGHIPACEIDWPRIRWHSEKQGLPLSVPLLPWPHAGQPTHNWCLEFRSFAEGSAHMTAEAIGGFCCTEPFPEEFLTEILRATRETDFPGSRFFELTPVDPAMTYWLEEMIIEDRIPKRWKFYRCNTQCNVDDPNSVVGKAWADDFFASVSEEMQEVRKTGAFATYEGLIYQTFNRAIHVVDEMEIPRKDVFHKRSIDWGASEEHPLACLFAYRDALGDWNIYAEYHSTDQTMVWEDHCQKINETAYWDYDSPYFKQTYGDPSRPDLFKEFAKNGIPVTAAKNAVFEGIESVRRALKVHPARRVPQLRIASWCKQTIKEFLTYRWEKSSGRGVNPKSARPVPLKRADDCMDALRYLIHTDYTGDGDKPRAGWVESKRRPQVRHQRLPRRR